MTSLLGLLADQLDPPAPEVQTDPTLTSAARFAEAKSRGAWKRAPHLDLIEREVMHAIETDGRLIISVSFRHGKSQYVARWLPAWYVATYRKRVILATAEKDLATAHGRFARDILVEYGHLFGAEVSKKSASASEWELAGAQGEAGMISLGVGGTPIGRGADLMIIDDPFRNFEDAMSPGERKRVKEWFTGTMASRLNAGKGAIVIICARWHEDDLSGFLLREDPDEWREIRLPAICDDEDDPLGREIGEPLWPEVYPLPALERMKRTMSLEFGETTWMAQAQQSPMAPGAGYFPSEKWAEFDGLPYNPSAMQWCRGWDLAASQGQGDFTVGVLFGWCPDPDNRFIVADVQRGQWAPEEWRQVMLDCARTDPPGTLIEIPQDPGGAGKDQAGMLAGMLAGFNVNVRPMSKSKEIRATTYSAQQRMGRVGILGAPDWKGRFVAEHELFPRGRHDDQVDAASSAFNGLVDPPIESEIAHDYDDVQISPY